MSSTHATKSAAASSITREGALKFGLLLATSLAPFLIADPAQAACTATNLPSGTSAVCTGTTNNVAITGAGLNQIVVQSGATLNNSSVTITGPDFSRVAVDGTANNLSVAGPQVEVRVFTGGLINGLNFNSAQGTLWITGGSVLAQPGSINIGDGSLRMDLNASSLFSSNNTAAYLVNAGSGANSVLLTRGTMETNATNQLINLGGGDDLLELSSDFALGTASGVSELGRTFEGGLGTDTFRLTGASSSALELTSSGFEIFELNGSGLYQFGGIGDWSQMNIDAGTLMLTRDGGLGANAGSVVLRDGTGLALNFGGSFYTISDSFITNSGGYAALSFLGGSGGTTYQLTGSNGSFSGLVNVGANTTVIMTAGDSFGSADVQVTGVVEFADFSIQNDFFGSGVLRFTGGSFAQLTGTNTHTGGIALAGSGTLNVLDVAALGTGGVTFSGGGRLQVSAATDQTLANQLTGFGTLVKAGQGVLTVTGANTYTGGTSIDGGAIMVGDFSALGTGTVSTNVDTRLILDYSGPNPLLRTTEIMTGDGTFVNRGTGTLVVDVASSYTGGTIIENGRVALNDGGALGTSSVLVMGPGILNIGDIIFANDIIGQGQLWKTSSGTGILQGDNSGFAGAISILDGRLVAMSTANLGTGAIAISANGELFIDHATDETMVNVLSGTGSFIKEGASRLTLTGGGSQFTGDISLVQGTLRLSGATAVNADSISLANASTTLELENTAGIVTYASDIVGLGRVVKLGAGTVELTGVNTYTGGTDILAGAIRVSALSALGTGPITVSQVAFLDLNITGSATWNGAVSGAGGLRMSGTGDLTLQSNTLTGGLDILSGRVIVTDPGATGGPVTTASGSAIVFDIAAGPNILSSVPISGGGQLIKEGAGSLIIDVANTFTGGTLINNGRVGLNDGAGLGTGAVTVGANGVLGLGGVQFGNLVTGAGSILKTANGQAVVTGANTFTGGTVVQGGSIRITQGSGLGTGSVSLAAGTSFILDHANAATTANVITGAGLLRKTGAGVTTLTGASTYTGGTQIQGGRLNLAAGATAGTGAIDISSGAQLSLESGTLANVLTGAGLVAKVGTGTATLSGVNTLTGGVLVAAGTLNAGLPALGTGAVQIDSGATLALTNTGNVAFGNALSGAGTLRLLGTDRLTFSNNFALGGIQVDAARLRLNAVAQSNVTVGANGALDGTGRIIGNLTNNGLVAPGNSIGTLTVQGNYTHGANSVLEIEFDANGGIDLLSVTGSATLNGGTLRFVSIGAAEGSGGTFLQAAGGVTGTFGTVETVGAVLPLSVIYQPNSAIMAPSILTARPSTFNAQFLAAGDAGFSFMDQAAAAASASPDTGQQIWAQAFASSAERDASGASLGYEHESSGIAGGYTYSVNPQVAVGVAGGLTSSDITIASSGGEGEQDGFLATAYGGYEGEGVSLVGGVMGGVVDQTATRNVRFSGFAASVTGETQSSLFGVFGGVTAPIGSYGGWELEASGRLALLNQTQDAYTESGTSPLRLRVAELSATTLEGQAGLAGETLFGEAERSSARFGFGVRYLDAEAVDVPVTFAGSNAGVTLETDARDTLHGYVEGGLGWAIGDSTTLQAGYHGQLGETERHEARVTISLNF